jgi:hypothetical protein
MESTSEEGEGVERRDVAWGWRAGGRKGEERGSRRARRSRVVTGENMLGWEGEGG